MKQLRLLILIYIVSVLVLQPSAFAVEKPRTVHNLDEVMARKARYATATFSPNESAVSPYFWQPETLCYTDNSTGSEVWRMTYKPLSMDVYSKEYSTQAWSGDGGKIGFRSTSSYRVPTNQQKDITANARWTMDADGSKLRIAYNAGSSVEFLNWLHTERSAFIYPSDEAGLNSAYKDTLFKVVVDQNNGCSKSILADSITGNSSKLTCIIKDPITSDDSLIVLQSYSVSDWGGDYPINCTKLFFVDLATNATRESWGAYREIGPIADPMFNLAPSCEIGFRSSSSALLNGENPLFFAHYGEYGCGPIQGYFAMELNGTAADGGPAWSDWDGDSYGDDQIRAWTDNAASTGNLPHNDYDNGYIGHPAFDRWGHYVLGDSSHDCNHQIYPVTDPVTYVRTGDKGCPGHVILDLHNNLANPPWYNSTNGNYLAHIDYISGHNSWTGWSDYPVGTLGYTNLIIGNHYQKTGVAGKDNYRAPDEIVDVALDLFGENTGTSATTITDANRNWVDNALAGKMLRNLRTNRESVITSNNATSATWGLSDSWLPGDEYRVAHGSDYSALPRPAQSPDGTKVAFSTVMFNSGYFEDATPANDGSYASISYAVAAYPHPPEITQVTSSGGTHTVRFDWRLDQANPRGYTTRGWPNEDTDNPPPPRETKEFRLWRSANGSSGWEPVAAVNAAIFEKYNFKTGEWTGNPYWEVSDTPGAGTWYYAVTSAEWSGLESRTLSNIYSSAGTQAAAYPSNPKGKSNFCTTYQPGIKRYYNIYAKDGSSPTATQSMRIASIPVAAEKEYIDWLGDQTGTTTQYLVTPVDSQGNEGKPLEGTRTPLSTAGQYLVEWTDTSGSIPVEGGSGQKIFMPYTASGDGLWTGIAITNVTNTTQSVSISARTDAGVYVGGKTFTVPAYGTYVDLLENFFTSQLSTFRASLTLCSALAGTNTFYATLFVGNPDGGFWFQNYTSVSYKWYLSI